MSTPQNPSDPEDEKHSETIPQKGVHEQSPRPQQRKKKGGGGFVMGLLATVVLVGGGAAACNILMAGEDGDTAEILDARTAEPADPEDLGTVSHHSIDSSAHVELGEVVEYSVHPPAGGEHYDLWQDCGVYGEPVRTELGVHSLEHGAVWITYDPEALDDTEIEILADYFSPGDYVLVSPMSGLPSPVVASGWGPQLLLDDPEASELEEFVREYERGPNTPEMGGPCSGGYSGTEADFEEEQEDDLVGQQMG